MKKTPLTSDPSYEPQTVSPSNPFIAGELAPTPSLLDPPAATPALSGPRAFFRRAFYGNTRPGTDTGRSTAFKRGLMIAGGIGLMIAGVIALVLVAKGAAFLSLVVPLGLLVLACLVGAGIAMCCFNLYKRFRERRVVTQITEESTYEPSRGYELDAHRDLSEAPRFSPVSPDDELQQFSSATHGQRQQLPVVSRPPAQNPYASTAPAPEYRADEPYGYTGRTPSYGTAAK